MLAQHDGVPTAYRTLVPLLLRPATWAQRGSVPGLVKLLQARGIPCSETSQQKLEQCSDVDTLERWCERAMRAVSETEIFAA